MKKDTKLQHLIRKIVKEELAKIKHEPPHSPPFEEIDEPRWGMFDEPAYESTYQQEHHDHSRALPGWSEPQPEEFGPPFISKRRKK